MIDLPRLKEEAHALLDDPQAAWVAGAILRILDDPSLVTPEGFSLVKRPELLGKGVAAR